MKEVNFVNADELKTLEEYGAALLSSMISLKTLRQFHISVFKLGLLDDGEVKNAETICWRIDQLLTSYKEQVENILERTQMKEEDILQSLRKIMPQAKIPRKRKETKNDNKATE